MAGRILTLSVFRYDPNRPGDTPRMQDFSIEETLGMTLYIALVRLRATQDPSLRFDVVCRAGICGACGMLVNGRPTLGCRTLTKSVEDGRITLHPLPGFRLLGDLTVDTGAWFRDMVVRTEAWIHSDRAFEPEGQEERMDNAMALRIYEAERCIECGCCVGGCLTAQLNPGFIGAAGINRVARFMLDPRDQRTERDYFEVVGNEDGTFGCAGLMACDDNCPMGLPLQRQLAWVRRRMAAAGLRREHPPKTR